MENEKIRQKIRGGLAGSRSIGRQVAINHLGELRAAIDDKRDHHLLDERLYREYLSGFDFNLPARLPGARAIWIVATPQSHVRVDFHLPDGPFSTIVPATYDYHSNARIEQTLRQVVEPEGYAICPATLPLKTLAVCSGLGRYGKNNVVYVEGLGSMCRLSAYYTDLPCGEDNWGKPQMAERCRKCTTCVEKCPTGAINPERFLLDAGRCLTFLNELEHDFPDWLDPAAHHCLVGCLYCQKFCPLNHEVSDWTTGHVGFTQAETELLLHYTPEKPLPEEMKQKFEVLGLRDGFAVLSRNLRMLVDSPDKSERDRMCAPPKKGRSPDALPKRDT